MAYFGYILLLFAFILFFIARPLTTLFHELGHAIPIVLLTKRQVSVYIGSYGDPKKSFNINIGPFKIWLGYNFFLWRAGVCFIPPNEQDAISGQATINQTIIILLGGPIASFIIATITCYFAFAYELHGAIKLVLIIFLGSAIADLFVNLIPHKEPIGLYDGVLAYNDGQQIKQYLYYKKSDERYKKAVELYNQGKYGEAAQIFHEMLDYNLYSDELYSLTISSYLLIKDFKTALVVFERFAKTESLNDNDFLQIGLIHSRLNQHEKAIGFYEKAMVLNPDNKYAFTNIGFTYSVQERYEEAILIFNQAIEKDEIYAYAYCNRGLAKIKMGHEEEGLKDINHALELNKDEAYAHRSLGIYYLDKKDFAQAIPSLKRARALEDDVYLINELLLQAEKGNGQTDNQTA